MRGRGVRGRFWRSHEKYHKAKKYFFADSVADGFQDASAAGKIQFGSGWWFLDQKERIELQLNAWSNCGLLSRFVGMVTDSRSFLSLPRHQYFRRVSAI